MNISPKPYNFENTSHYVPTYTEWLYNHSGVYTGNDLKEILKELENLSSYSAYYDQGYVKELENKYHKMTCSAHVNEYIEALLGD